MAVEKLTTNNLRPQEQFSFWNEAVCRAFTALDCQRPQSPSSSAYSGQLETLDLNTIQITRVRCDASSVNHNKQQVAASTENVQLVHMQLGGISNNSQCGREALLRPGDFTICDSTQPYQLEFEQAIDMMVVKIPTSIFEQHFKQDQNLYSQRFSPDDSRGMAAVFNGFINNLWQHREQVYTPAQLQSLANSTMSLLSGHFGDFVGPGRADEDSVQQGLLRGMQLFIQQNLHEPELSAEMVARANRISTRYLRTVFSSAGLSCAKYINEQRLQTAARLLKDPAFERSKVIDIAFRCGFQDASHFSRRFSEHFGLSPKAYRQK
jgi:AraC-like DNA-binding protein